MTRSVRVLGHREREALETLLLAGGTADTWMRHALATGGTASFVGVFDGAQLIGAAIARKGAISASSLTGTEAAEAMVPALRALGPWFSVVGPVRPCTAIIRALAPRGVFRVDREQILMAVESAADLLPGTGRLRQARADDVPQLAPLVARYRREDGLTLPDEDQGRWIRTHVTERVGEGAIYVVDDDGELVFTGAFNFRGRSGSGLGGIFTVPDRRGEGIGARGTSDLCRLALTDGPLTTLHVDARNEAALRCYERAGLRRVGRFRLTFR